jgi:PAS domain S-box-containing protein
MIPQHKKALIKRLSQTRPQRLIAYGVIACMTLSVPFAMAFSLIFRGYIATDYLITGLIASCLVSAFVLYCLGTLLEEIRSEGHKIAQFEAYYHILFKSIKDCVCIISAEGKFVEVNETMCLINGYRSISEPIGTDFLVNVIDQCKLQEALEKALKGQTVHIEYRSLTKDERVIWWDSVLSPVIEPDGSIKRVIRISRDITEKKGAEEGLKETLSELRRIRAASLNIMEDIQHEIAERKKAEMLLIEKTNYLDSVLRSSNIAIAATDLDFHIKYYNPVAEEIFGYKAEEVIGRTVMEMHTRERVDPARFERAIETVKREGKYEYVVEQHKKEGIRIIESVVSGILDKDSNLIGYLLFSIDATQRRQMEQELRKLNQELQQRVTEEVEKQRQQEQLLLHQSRMAAMGEMIGAIAHQWRQPLNAVGLIVQDIKDAYEYGELDRQYLDRQVNQAMALIKRMSKTIDDFRNFFRPDKERQSFDLKGVFGTVLGICSHPN